MNVAGAGVLVVSFVVVVLVFFFNNPFYNRANPLPNHSKNEALIIDFKVVFFSDGSFRIEMADSKST